MERVTNEVVKEIVGRIWSGLTLQDVNISFNYVPLYYLISRGDGGIVARGCLVTKPGGRKSNT